MFLDVVTNQKPNPYSFEEFENLESLDLEPELEEEPLKVLIYSGQFKDSGSILIFKDMQPTEDD